MHVNKNKKIIYCKVCQSIENKQNINTKHLIAFLTLTVVLKYYITR